MAEYGRELYTSPFVWINWNDLKKVSKDTKTGKYKVKDTFSVEMIKIKDKRIIALSIINQDKKRVFTYTEKKIEG